MSRRSRWPMPALRRLLALCLAAAVPAAAVSAHGDRAEGPVFSFEPVPKPRVIVLTDITNEPDDQQSLVRFLVYSNEYDVEGLIATTSTWLRDRVRPDEIIKTIRAYGEVRENLARHADGYPTAEHLLSVVRAHVPLYGMAGVGEGRSSEGSRHIIDVVDRAEDDRPVWITVWGGANCLAQALWEVRETRAPEAVGQFVSRLRVYAISDQDDSGPWMRAEFPDLFYIVSPTRDDWREYYRSTWTGIAGDRHYHNGPMHRFELVDNPWLEAHIMSRGPLGALYPPSAYIMEGDTPSFLGLVANGLGSAASPSYGGWGGRYVLYRPHGETRPIWTNNAVARDAVTAEDGRTYVSAQATIWRWREAYQHDFAARMQWSVAARYADANHNPVAAIGRDRSRAIVRVRAAPGDEIVLDATASSDPDGDEVTVSWFVYREAGTYPGEVALDVATPGIARLVAPDVKEPADVHVICEVRDSGSPALFACRRIIVTVQPAAR